MSYSADVIPNEPVMVDIVSEGITTIHVRGIDSNTSYVTCQIHSHLKKLTLSSSPSKVDGESLIGYNIGMITVLETKLMYNGS